MPADKILSEIRYRLRPGSKRLGCWEYVKTEFKEYFTHLELVDDSIKQVLRAEILIIERLLVFFFKKVTG